MSETPGNAEVHSTEQESPTDGHAPCKLRTTCLDAPIKSWVSDFTAKKNVEIVRFWLQPRPSPHRYPGQTFGTTSSGVIAIPEGFVVEEAILWGGDWQVHFLSSWDTPNQCRLAEWSTADAKSPLDEVDIVSGTDVRLQYFQMIRRESMLYISGLKGEHKVSKFFDGPLLKWFLFI